MSVFRTGETPTDTSRQGQLQTSKDPEEAEFDELLKKKRAAEAEEQRRTENMELTFKQRFQQHQQATEDPSSQINTYLRKKKFQWLNKSLSRLERDFANNQTLAKIALPRNKSKQRNFVNKLSEVSRSHVYDGTQI